MGKRGLDASGSGYGLVAGSCEHSNEPLGSMKGIKFSRRKKDSVPWS
jgi:hypothetical protein